MKSFWLEDRFPAKPESETFLLTLLFYCRWLLLLRSLLFRPAPWQLYLFANISRGLSSSMAAAIKVRLLVSAVVYEELHVSRMFVVGLLLFLNAWLKCLLGCQNLRNALKNDLFLSFLSMKVIILLSATFYFVGVCDIIDWCAIETQKWLHISMFFVKLIQSSLLTIKSVSHS